VEVAAMVVGDLVAYLRLEDRQFNAGMASAEGRFMGFGKKMMALAGIGIGVDALYHLAKSAVSTAISIQATETKLNAVFGKSGDAVRKWAEQYG
jgi:hypothetical protein